MRACRLGGPRRWCERVCRTYACARGGYEDEYDGDDVDEDDGDDAGRAYSGDGVLTAILR